MVRNCASLSNSQLKNSPSPFDPAKTKALLFEGAKHASNGVNGCVTANGFSQHKEDSSHLLHRKGKDKEMCKGCSQREANKLFVCSHCQLCVCSLECLKQCCVCAQLFCPYCSVLKYVSSH